MSAFHEKDNTLYAEDVALTTIAEQVGTPTYVYSAAHIRAQYEKLESAVKRALPADRQPLLCYACKANSNIAVLRLLQKLGSGLEIVSEGELRRGLKAGFTGDKIVSTGVGKTTREIKALLDAKVYQINIESLEELERIGKVTDETGQKASVVFRLNPDIGGGGHGKITTGRKQDKFGISASLVFKGFEMAKAMKNVDALGLSMHIGSQVSNVATFKDAFEKIPALVNDLRAKGYEITRLDIGGGFPIQYNHEDLLDLDAYAEWVRDIIAPLGTDIVMEPGRYLVGNSGVLLTRVEYVKRADDRQFLVLDAAMNDLIRPTLYDAYHGIEPVQNRDAAPQTYDVVGPICETGDTFSRDRSLPTMTQDDLAVIKSSGAYGYCMASNYNTRGRPAEVMVNGDSFAVIRPRETLDEIIDKDIIPDWLS